MKNNLNNLYWLCVLKRRFFSRTSTINTQQSKTRKMEGRHNIVLNFLQSLNAPDLLTSQNRRVQTPSYLWLLNKNKLNKLILIVRYCFQLCLAIVVEHISLSRKLFQKLRWELWAVVTMDWSDSTALLLCAELWCSITAISPFLGILCISRRNWFSMF